MNTQINVTGHIQESGTFQVRETLWQPASENQRETEPVPSVSVLEQGSSVMAPGPLLPLAR